MMWTRSAPERDRRTILSTWPRSFQLKKMAPNLTEWSAARQTISAMYEQLYDPSAGAGKHSGFFARGLAGIPSEWLAAPLERHPVTFPTSRDTDGEPDGVAAPLADEPQAA